MKKLDFQTWFNAGICGVIPALMPLIFVYLLLHFAGVNLFTPELTLPQNFDEEHRAYFREICSADRPAFLGIAIALFAGSFGGVYAYWKLNLAGRTERD